VVDVCVCVLYVEYWVVVGVFVQLFVVEVEW